MEEGEREKEKVKGVGLGERGSVKWNVEVHCGAEKGVKEIKSGIKKFGAWRLERRGTRNRSNFHR